MIMINDNWQEIPIDPKGENNDKELNIERKSLSLKFDNSILGRTILVYPC